MMWSVWKLIFICIVLPIVNALIDPTDLPEGLAECFEMKTKYSNVKEVPSEDICISCITDYLWKHGKHVHCFNRTEHDITWVANLLAELHPDTAHRYRRTAPRRPCRRKEYRMLSDNERKDYHRAINKMKADKTVLPNRYDAFVIFHSGMAGNTSHRGPNFCGWHRILLIMYEHSLQRQVPGVCLPYWDSTLDAAMRLKGRDPVNSVIWGKDFMGNGDGQVQEGPFSHWVNIDKSPLIRNIGGSGQLMTKRLVLNILSKTKNEEIIEPSRNPLSSLEGCHDQVHKWVGGKMFDVDTSPMDPIFFMHHAYIDCIWEIFRRQQIKNGTNPDLDYPITKDVMQHPGQYMANLPAIPGVGRLKNIDGYSSRWTKMYYFYDPPPTCSRRNMDCGSKYIECDPWAQLCISKSKQAMSFQYPTYDGFNFWQWLSWYRRGKRDTRRYRYDSDSYDYEPQVPNQVSYDKLSLSVPNEVSLGSPIQNIFKIDCKEDIKTWAFAPVTVIHIRPKEMKLSEHVIEDGIFKQDDMYNESNYQSLRSHILPGSPAMHDDCIEDKSGAFRIGLVSYGLSYSGWYEDYVVIDNRQPISSHTGYIAFRKPQAGDTGPVKVFVTATDTCGRMCKARCLKHSSDGGSSYIPCDGVLQVTNKTPVMYSDSYGDAINSIWDFSDAKIPYERKVDVSLIFYCDYSDTWPWERCNK